MAVRGLLFVAFASAILLGSAGGATDTEKPTGPSSTTEPASSSSAHSKLPLDLSKLIDEESNKVDQAVIHPFRSANVGAEVSGVVKAVNFEEGEKVEHGDVVVEMFQERDASALKKAEEKLKGLELEIQRDETDVKIKQELLSLGAVSIQELKKAEAEVEITAQKIKEAEEDLKVAQLNFEACKVRAPFAGFLAVRYKQPYETVERLEKVFALVDCAKVYAVANVPENLFSKFVKGADAVFVHTLGKKYKGKVDKVGTLVDPKSMTKRVYVLIDNSSEDLQVGLTGNMELAE